MSNTDLGTISVDAVELPEAKETAKGIGAQKCYVMKDGSISSRIPSEGVGDVDHMAFVFPNDEVFRVNPRDAFPENVIDALAFHGAYQVGGDSWSGIKEAAAKAGRDPVEYAIAQLSTRFDTMTNGFWVAQATGGTSRPTDLIVAVAEWGASQGMDKSFDEWKSALAKMPEDKKTALRQMKEVRIILDRIADERRAKRAEELQARESDNEAIAELLS